MTDALTGLLSEVDVVQRGSNATVAAAVGATSITVDDPTDYSSGAVVMMDGDSTIYTLTSDPTGDVLTISPALAVAVTAGDPIHLMIGGQIAVDTIGVVSLGSTDDDTPGTSVRVPLTYVQAGFLPPGQYDPPLPVTIAADHSHILDILGVQAAPDTSWVSLTPAIGTGLARYRARGNLLRVQIDITGVSIASGSQATLVAAGGIPAAYCPTTYNEYGHARINGGGLTGNLIVLTDGSIRVQQATGSTATWVQGYVDCWIN